MRKALTLLCALAVFSLSLHAQNIVRGKISDTLEKKPVSNAVVAVLDKKDSVLVSFTRSKPNGEFSIPVNATGKFVLLVTCPKFADFAEEIDVKQSPLEVGTIALTQKAQLLEEVVIRGVQAIRIKGDTTEFLADSFAVREGATVEELLKKLPGFQVDAKGNITAQGQRVQKVLVDGEEFFGDDPTMATQNIGAKAVKKVQVFDTKSDQQKLTGLSNGNDGKTINIELKADKKRGAFGKAYAGTDFNEYVDAKAMYNNFVGKKKISLYASKSNLNTVSLNWDEERRLGLDADPEYDAIMDSYMYTGGGNEFSDWNLRGLPDSYTAGGLFINKWHQDKHAVNGSYRYNRLGTENISSTLTQNILGDSVTYTNNFQNTETLNEQHAVNAKYEWKADSLATFKLVSAGKYRNGNNITDATSEYLNGDGVMINQNQRRNNAALTRREIDNQATYTQLFKKRNRQLIASLRFGLKDEDQDARLYAKTNFYENGEIGRDTVTDQQKKIGNKSLAFGSKITYAEPISDKLRIIGAYSLNTSNSTSDYNTFNLADNGKYELRDSLFSNNFDLDITSHSGTALLRYDTKKTKFTVGSGISSIKLKLLNVDNKIRNNYNFLNYTPVAFFSYSPKQQTFLHLRYNGNTVQPSIDQLQPLRNNNDPLNIFVGNPNLEVGFNHDFGVGYYSYKVLGGQYFNLNANYTLRTDAVAMANTIDEKGRRSYTPVNVNGNYNWGVYSYFGLGQGEKKLKHNIRMNANGGNNIAFINGEKSDNKFTTLGVGYGIGYDIKDKFNFRIEPRVNYNTSKSSLQKDIENNYFTFGANSDLYVKLPWDFELNMQLNSELRQKIAAFDRNINVTVWNASLARKVFKDKSGKIIFEAFDILNQNRGYNRVINSNFVTDEYYSRISQYFLLKFEWSFSKMPGVSK
jgi:hypothetical protein